MGPDTLPRRPASIASYPANDPNVEADLPVRLLGRTRPRIHSRPPVRRRGKTSSPRGVMLRTRFTNFVDHVAHSRPFVNTRPHAFLFMDAACSTVWVPLDPSRGTMRESSPEK